MAALCGLHQCSAAWRPGRRRRGAGCGGSRTPALQRQRSDVGRCQTSVRPVSDARLKAVSDKSRRYAAVHPDGAAYVTKGVETALGSSEAMLVRDTPAATKPGAAAVRDASSLALITGHPYLRKSSFILPGCVYSPFSPQLYPNLGLYGLKMVPYLLGIKPCQNSL